MLVILLPIMVRLVMTAHENNMTFKTNKVKGMVLDSLGRLSLGSVTPSAISTLYVSGSSYITGNELVQGTITTQQNLHLQSLSGKIGVGVAVAESSIHTMNLKTNHNTFNYG